MLIVCEAISPTDKLNGGMGKGDSPPPEVTAGTNGGEEIPPVSPLL